MNGKPVHNVTTRASLAVFAATLIVTLISPRAVFGFVRQLGMTTIKSVSLASIPLLNTNTPDQFTTQQLSSNTSLPSSSFYYTFNTDGTLDETGSMAESKSQY